MWLLVIKLVSLKKGFIPAIIIYRSCAQLFPIQLYKLAQAMEKLFGAEWVLPTWHPLGESQPSDTLLDGSD